MCGEVDPRTENSLPKVQGSAEKWEVRSDRVEWQAGPAGRIAPEIRGIPLARQRCSLECNVAATYV
ncbi:hypothetical protein J2T21_000768 [Paeniglutamicibacter psychrophenolicus]|nr:hypothetical protein [Paeniglutamicibacter psychrophenolicus]